MPDEQLDELLELRRGAIDEAMTFDLMLAGVDPRGYRHGPDYTRWRRETIQAKAAKQREIVTLNRQIADRRATLRPEPLPDAGRTSRYVRIEAKLDLLLGVLGVTIPEELRRPTHPVEPEPPEADDVPRDQHGTPYDDAIAHRLPGSFESGKRQ